MDASSNGLALPHEFNTPFFSEDLSNLLKHIETPVIHRVAFVGFQRDDRLAADTAAAARVSWSMLTSPRAALISCGVGHTFPRVKSPVMRHLKAPFTMSVSF